MTRQPHDQFAKQYLEELLALFGAVEISREITTEVRQIDVWFAPKPGANPQILGLLGQLVTNPCMLEPFRNQPSKTEIRNCLLKLFALHSQFQRRARRENEEIAEDELPFLWILATSASSTLLDHFGFTMDRRWPQGIYVLAKGHKTGLVAINQLPSTPETLWLRILGKGTTQERAINELIALPPTDQMRHNILELIYSWRVNIESKANLTEDDRELIMQLSPAYLQAREEVLRQGRQEERRDLIANLLKVRFGSLDEELSQAIAPLLALPPEEYSRLLLQLSRQELLTMFGIGNH